MFTQRTGQSMSMAHTCPRICQANERDSYGSAINSVELPCKTKCLLFSLLLPTSPSVLLTTAWCCCFSFVSLFIIMKKLKLTVRSWNGQKVDPSVGFGMKNAQEHEPMPCLRCCTSYGICSNTSAREMLFLIFLFFIFFSFPPTKHWFKQLLLFQPASTISQCLKVQSKF